MYQFYKNVDFFLGEFNGEATITFLDPAAAQYCVTWFDGKDFNGHKIKVHMAMVRPRRQNNNFGQLRGNFFTYLIQLFWQW